MLDYSIRPRLHRKITSPSFLGKNLFSRSAAAWGGLESKKSSTANRADAPRLGQP